MVRALEGRESALSTPFLARLGRRLRTPWFLRALALSASVSALCLRSLTADGYLLQLDATYGPVAPAPSWGFMAPVTLLQDAAAWVIGTANTGRLYVALALFLCAFTPMYLLRDKRWYAQGAAGLLGALNPWVYARIVEGQWGVVVAAAGLFLWVAAWEHLQRQPGFGSASALAAVSVGIAAFSDAFLPIVVTLGVLGAVCQRFWHSADRVRWTAVAVLMTFGALLYAIVPFFLVPGSRSYAQLQLVNGTDLRTFAAAANDRYGLLPNVIGLYGYWGERQARFPLLNAGESWWIFSAAALTVMACIGALRNRSRAWLLAAGVIGILVSASTASPAGLSIAEVAVSKVPILGALREPQKFDALWLLVLVILCAEAVHWAGESVRAAKRAPRVHAGALTATVMIMATALPAGILAAVAIPTRVKPLQYPANWHVAARYVEMHVPVSDQIVVLPWHQYETLPFTDGRLVGNPAAAFFPRNLIVPNDLEIAGHTSEDPSADPIGALAHAPSAHGCPLARTLLDRGVRWAIVENATGSSAALAALTPCGFRVVSGGPGDVRVLQGA